MTENRNNMQRYAMLFGTYMGIYWVLKFILFPLGMTSPFLLLLFIGLTMGVPVMGYFYTRMYRNQVCGGSITWGHAWLFTTFMYMFASLLTAVAHYIYFRFIDGGYILRICEEQIAQLSQENLPGMDTYIASYQQALEQMSLISPLDITLNMFSSNVCFGMILAIPTALFVMRNRPTHSGTPTN